MNLPEVKLQTNSNINYFTTLFLFGKYEIISSLILLRKYETNNHLTSANLKSLLI